MFELFSLCFNCVRAYRGQKKLPQESSQVCRRLVPFEQGFLYSRSPIVLGFKNSMSPISEVLAGSMAAIKPVTCLRAATFRTSRGPKDLRLKGPHVTKSYHRALNLKVWWVYHQDVIRP